MNGASICVIEDDIKIASVLIDYLHANTYRTTHFVDGLQAFEALRTQNFDVVLLDRMLPGLDGVSLCQRLREFSAVPVIMLTAMVEEEDKLDGLDAGADDYVCKPFSPREVVARVKAQLRRSQFASNNEVSEVWPYVVNQTNMSISMQGKTLNLTPVEYRILAELLLHPGRVYSRQQLLDVASDDNRDSSDRTIDAHIKNLRKKVDAISDLSQRLQSVYGVGYRFALPQE
ncbi:response regulator [Undibacterium sp. LX40W]|uniref:Response regulator n=1 Tax=Undibacterium nitidum TaxID=2762298 RepID=A0A923HWC6_9BURK|nr:MULTISPECIES: response regulator [Undibacterium]MBC3882594.1 response regulator [Undibacterium nitidum]MBC3892875.1 response regulator [Undibacterium sp. LX40W]